MSSFILAETLVRIGLRCIIADIPGRDAEAWRGKSGIVVGSGNTAHDIIQDMAAAGVTSITLIQRSPTFLFPLSSYHALADQLYNEVMPTNVADRVNFGPPIPVARLIAMAGVRAEADKNPEYFDRIEAQGFKTVRYGDLISTLNEKEGGHFFDVGGGELIASGRVKVKSDALPVRYTERGLELDDGSAIDADVIVFATGYRSNIKGSARQIFGDVVAREMSEWLQCDEEGEVRGAFRDTGSEWRLTPLAFQGLADVYVSDPRIWYTGQGFDYSRYYSRFVAMRIKADVDGVPIKPYLDTPE